jgi:hypothetical protein
MSGKPLCCAQKMKETKNSTLQRGWIDPLLSFQVIIYLTTDLIKLDILTMTHLGMPSFSQYHGMTFKTLDKPLTLAMKIMVLTTGSNGDAILPVR